LKTSSASRILTTTGAVKRDNAGDCVLERKTRAWMLETEEMRFASKQAEVTPFDVLLIYVMRSSGG